jgi:large conductance mechanosensitive channel
LCGNSYETSGNSFCVGNVIDLAVAVVVGAAFTAVVRSFANDVLMGFIGALFGKPNFNRVVWHIGDGTSTIGRFITQLVNFLIIAFAVFVVVKLFEKAPATAAPCRPEIQRC